ncbi:MAG: phosphate signaling complex protein PhoU [Chloroflexi bacterium]|nr:phosphate signaling complex protein PhoU [Chloroflexota bacterium]
MAMERHPTRQDFDRLLQEVQDDVIAMGSMVDRAIERSTEALLNRDANLAQQVVAEDERIDSTRFEIEEKAIRLIATQQPMAGDLRVLVTVLNVIVDLERMADHAEGNGRIAQMIGADSTIRPLGTLPRMADKCRDMLRRVLSALVDHDADTARKICEEDDEVDAMQDLSYHSLLQTMLENPSRIQEATYLLWATHNLERIADRTTNIAERVVFLVTGHMEELASKL